MYWVWNIIIGKVVCIMIKFGYCYDLLNNKLYFCLYNYLNYFCILIGVCL